MCAQWVPAGLNIKAAAMYGGPLGAGNAAYASGRFVDALKYWRRAAGRSGGAGEAEFAIGLLYRKGEGVFRNFAEAGHWFERASKRGHVEAKLELGKLLMRGATDGEIDRLRILRSDPTSGATEELASLIFPHGGRIEPDPARARELLDAAEAAGFVEASELLAMLYLNGE